ncbi:MAG: Ig-like domain-containing protein [Gemmatimonadota bacterium]|nr:Ig-like domain-containing protein [Gemmatimonadota bacterium]
MKIPRILLAFGLLAACSEPSGPSARYNVTITPPELLLTRIGQTAQLSVVASNLIGYPIRTEGAVWSSLNAAVVSVDSAGWVTSHAEGVARIRAEVRSVADTVNVFVRLNP